MKALPPNDIAALVALVGLGVGVMLVVGTLAGVAAGMGAALIIVSALVLIYLIIPDKSGGAT
jgi:hypothetical protein